MVIAICDDNMEIQNVIEQKSTAILKAATEEISFLKFQSGEDFICAIQNETEIDLLLLDIDMPGISGLEVAEILKDKEEIPVIFISSYEQYVFDTFKYRPVYFVRKDRMQHELLIALKMAMEIHEKKRDSYILLRCEEGDVRIKYSEIVYFEIILRKMYIYLLDGMILHARISMRELLEELSVEQFVKIHNGCAVNLKYVRSCNSNNIQLENGKILTASRAGMKEFKLRFLQYWR